MYKKIIKTRNQIALLITVLVLWYWGLSSFLKREASKQKETVQILHSQTFIVDTTGHVSLLPANHDTIIIMKNPLWPCITKDSIGYKASYDCEHYVRIRFDELFNVKLLR